MPLSSADLAALTQLEVLRMTQENVSARDWEALLARPLSDDGLIALSAEAAADHAFNALEATLRAEENGRAQLLRQDLLGVLQRGSMLGRAPDGNFWPGQEQLLQLLFDGQDPAQAGTLDLPSFARTLLPALQRAVDRTPAAEHDEVLLRLPWQSQGTEDEQLLALQKLMTLSLELLPRRGKPASQNRRHSALKRMLTITQNSRGWNRAWNPAMQELIWVHARALNLHNHAPSVILLIRTEILTSYTSGQVQVKLQTETLVGVAQRHSARLEALTWPHEQAMAWSEARRDGLIWVLRPLVCEDRETPMMSLQDAETLLHRSDTRDWQGRKELLAADLLGIISPALGQPGIIRRNLPELISAVRDRPSRALAATLAHLKSSEVLQALFLDPALQENLTLMAGWNRSLSSRRAKLTAQI